ncbi:MAG TPA: M1 family metallopeptidase [Acidimicrobiales bacterium]|jgi:puromycin-sensitive aminopeptidase
MPDLDPYRLPRTVVPSRYELTIAPDLDTATFTGEERVEVDVVEPVTELVLNAADLDVDDAWLEPAAGGTPSTATVTLDADNERVRLSVEQPLDPGAWVLHIRFRGVLNDKLTGFYRSTFTDDNGDEHVIAVTQFEATHARRAFPCWDEPEMKAVFAVTLDVADHLTAVSNAREQSNEPTGAGRRRIRFADTMTMSTYLVAFIVGPLEATAPIDVDGAPLRVVHAPAKAHLTHFAAESAAFALPYFADYYGIAYPGDKCDLVAVPDFAFGAMENLGCITFREVLLLVDPERSTQPELQNVADVIHHELAHMWFGDLVTMKWWNGIWLNEAFATFMEMKCTDAFRPEWERWVSFGLARTAAFEVDSLASTRPIEFEVVSPDDAEGMFDVLTYEKGAAVLLMLEQYLGEDVFRDGIRHYLGLHQYANTETTDLWDSIEESSGQPVRQIMDSWIFQGGYPVVEVEIAGERTVRLRQERFSYGLDGDDGDIAATTWVVPVLLVWSNGERIEQRKVLLTDREQDIEFADPVRWVFLNHGGSGFYRTRYRGVMRERLATHISRLSPLERYNIVDDAFASVLQGSSTSAEFLELARSFADDTDLAVWQRLAGAFASLDRIVDDDTRPRLQATVRALAAPALHRMGWAPKDGETDRDKQTRATLFELVGTVGADDDAAARARSIHDAYLADPDAADPAMAAVAVNVIADHGGPDDFAAFLDRFRTSTNPQEQMRYLYSLARFRDKASFEQMLELSMSEVRTQNAPFLLGRALMSREHGAEAWDFIRRHWPTVMERFPSSTVVRMAEGVRALSDPAVAQDVLSFFAEHPLPQAAQTMAQHLERLRVNVAFREREQPALAAALE